MEPARRGPVVRSCHLPPRLIAKRETAETSDDGNGHGIRLTLPNTRVCVLEHAGHFPFVEAAEQMTQSVGAFVTRPACPSRATRLGW
jgi:pimeloyl-ACP methyl ester carboxylesterase